MATTKKKGFWYFFESVLSGRGKISAKRVMGVWLILLVSGCTLWAVIANGISDPVQDLLETELIVGASLLGITSVTGIFKRHQITVDKDSVKEETDGSDE